MKTVNVNITIQLEVAENGNTLNLVKDRLELINTILENSCLENQAHIFVEGVDGNDVTRIVDGVPVEENLLPFAVNLHDGREEYWDFFATEEVARTLFETYRENREDAHLYKLTDNKEYEVIDSTWDESWE